MEWTNDKVEHLRKLWQEGLSASKIALALGGDVSRNAVIGKVHRLKLMGRLQNTTTMSRKKNDTANIPDQNPNPVFEPISPIPSHVNDLHKAEEITEGKYNNKEEDFIPDSLKLSLIELTEKTCKWPNGDPLQKDFSFCGNDTMETGPYCSYHAKIAFQSISERRRVHVRLK